MSAGLVIEGFFGRYRGSRPPLCVSFSLLCPRTFLHADTFPFRAFKRTTQTHNKHNTTQQVYDLLNHASSGGGAPPPSGPQAAFGRGGAKRPGGLRLRWLPGRGFYLEDVTIVTCSSAEEALAHFRTGVKNKARRRRGISTTSFISLNHPLAPSHVKSVNYIPIINQSLRDHSSTGDGGPPPQPRVVPLPRALHAQRHRHPARQRGRSRGAPVQTNPGGPGRRAGSSFTPGCVFGRTRFRARGLLGVGRGSAC